MLPGSAYKTEVLMSLTYVLPWSLPSVKQLLSNAKKGIFGSFLSTQRFILTGTSGYCRDGSLLQGQQNRVHLCTVTMCATFLV